MSYPIKVFKYRIEDKNRHGQLLFDFASTNKTNTYFKMSSGCCFQLSSVITWLWKQKMMFLLISFVFLKKSLLIPN